MVAELNRLGVKHAVDLEQLAKQAVRERLLLRERATGVRGEQAAELHSSQLPEWAKLGARHQTHVSVDASSAGEETGEESNATWGTGAHETLAALRGLDGAGLLVARESTIRGLDLPRLKLVFISMVPDDAESYVHIVGRTARRGRTGDVVNIWTQREFEKAGALTMALRGIHFKRAPGFPPLASRPQR